MEERIWHKSYPGGVPSSMDFEDLTMPQILARTAKKHPDRDALVYMGRRISYAELDRLANRFANGLERLGVRAGDRVALLLPNIPQIVIAYFGLWRMGAVSVPNNPLYTDRELEHQLNDSGATAIVTLDLLAPRMLALRDKTRVRTVITAHVNDYLPFPLKQLFPFVKKDMYRKYEKAADYHQFLDVIKGASPDFSGSPPALDDLAHIPYTGGTTGLSKGVSLTHRNISRTAQITRAWVHDLKDLHEKELAVFPFFHIAGFNGVMNLSIINGWTDVLMPRPEPQAVYEMMLKYKPTVVPAVPTIFVGLLAIPEFRNMDRSFVKAFLTGAAPLALETISDLTSTGASIIEGYGMTESTGFTSYTPWRGVFKQGSVGVPVCDTDVRIVDVDTGEKDMPLGQEGELIFRGPQTCQGYYRNPDETAKTIRDGWFYSGDIAKMDEDGYLYIVDRKKDMIIAGGYNIYPRDIDEVLYEHPKVLEACAVGMPDPYRGETVKAFVVPKPGETVTEEELNAFCRERLAAYKVPRLYEFLPELPKSAVGKVLRRELRDRDRDKT
ncbi:MAG: long-chain fatty acid--CoA ligase [Proteobacteria bacterium]|nr:long-chain fatty acid--CoA ligase [Pseudomonadota bacterium]